ncbi:MAG: LysE family translocator [Desulfobacterales bacterium]|jgi:homoserine/homoserine lactone efflux protein|nr:LysE family translocator [Desulfobacterales bacterium]
MSFEFLLIYSVTVFVASIIPGPSMLLALTHGMKYGARRTTVSALGNLSVTLIQAGISIAGLGAILLASENIFNIVKWAGAIYLVYMGISIWRSPSMSITEKSSNGNQPEAPLRKMYLQAAFVTAGNPKAIVFFTAVFPQFIDPNIAFIPQCGMLMGTGGIIAFCCFMAYAIGGQNIVRLFSEASVGKYVNRVIGGTFIGAGIGLASSNK